MHRIVSGVCLIGCMLDALCSGPAACAVRSVAVCSDRSDPAETAGGAFLLSYKADRTMRGESR